MAPSRSAADTPGSARPDDRPGSARPDDRPGTPRPDGRPSPRPDARPATNPVTPTGRVILGMIGLGVQTGYEIKQLVDKSTRFFWAASYGQIYPELRRLEEAGLIRGRSEPTGARPRTVYEVTDAGRDALAQWLRSDATPTFELRDESILKIFFSDALPENRREVIAQMRALHEQKLAQLQALELDPGEASPGPYLALSLGLRIMGTYVEWCREVEAQMNDGGEAH